MPFNSAMAPRFQRTTLSLGMLLCLVLLALWALATYVVLSQGLGLGVLGRISGVPAWSRALPEPRRSGVLLWSVLAASGGLALFGLLAEAGLRGLYVRTASPEIFFLGLFCLALSLEAMKPFNLLLEARAQSIYWMISISRLVLFGRFAASLSLMVASLYAVGMRYSQYRLMLAGIVILALTLAGVLPVDATQFQANLLLRLGDPASYWVIELTLSALALVNLAVAAWARHLRRFLLVALGVLLLLAGRAALYAGVFPIACAAGAFALAAGVLLASRHLGVIYLGI